MANYVGIDLGTTNSAISSYDGNETRIWKSPEQNDVTPSAIFIDRRGNKFIGKRAYDSAPLNPDNSATLFKRLMGTSTPIKFPSLGISKTPEECSSEILKVLYGYLPEDIRENGEIGTVITVPAAFNQMQKEATMQAANLAGIGKTALLQEPVAAVMSVMKTRASNGMFLIYDLGGGTLDIAIAESMNGRVNLLSHGGIAMCGGRDFDRSLLDNVIKPWLKDNFNLKDNFLVDPKYKSLIRLSVWAAEKAKIELSSNEDSVISLSENETRVQDDSGNDIYLDIPITRTLFDSIIEERVNESINKTREVLSSSGLSPHDLEKIVFIGGPTNYKPLRDKVSFELGVESSIDVNPMTAVAEGASIFAESIDWSSQDRVRKNTRGKVTLEELNLSFNYISRTPELKTFIGIQIKENPSQQLEFQIDSNETGWTSGRIKLKNGTKVELTLSQKGENLFKVSVYDETGHLVHIKNDIIKITRTAATIDAIPASHSVGIEVLDKVGGVPTLDYLVKAGDSLPVKGKRVFKAAETLKAGDQNSINLKLWEGEIESPITDNRPIGVLKISGFDFDDGVIYAGADLECDYEILDSGNIILEVSVPCIGGTFQSGKNFYSRQEGQIDYSDAKERVNCELEQTISRVNAIQEKLKNQDLSNIKSKLESLNTEDSNQDPEKVQEKMEKILEVKKELAKIRKNNLKEIRSIDLNRNIEMYENLIKKLASPGEKTVIENLINTANKSIDRNDNNFEQYIEEIITNCIQILWKQDGFVIARFKDLEKRVFMSSNRAEYEHLLDLGRQYLQRDDIGSLRGIVVRLSKLQVVNSSEQSLLDVVNIVRS